MRRRKRSHEGTIAHRAVSNHLSSINVLVIAPDASSVCIADLETGSTLALCRLARLRECIFVEYKKTAELRHKTTAILALVLQTGLTMNPFDEGKMSNGNRILHF